MQHLWRGGQCDTILSLKVTKHYHGDFILPFEQMRMQKK